MCAPLSTLQPVMTMVGLGWQQLCALDINTQITQRVSGMSLIGPAQGVRYAESSQYLVNNSFHCGLQPKRASNDLHLYLLLHKKILRKAVIDKRFEDNLNAFYHSSSPSKSAQPAFPSQPTFPAQPGFRGRLIRLRHSQPKSPKQLAQFRIKARATTCQFQLDEHPSNRLIEQRRAWIGHQNISNRPNMMYNLTLYRRGFRKNEAKSKSNCVRVLEDYKHMLDHGSQPEDSGRQRRLNTLM